MNDICQNYVFTNQISFENHTTSAIPTWHSANNVIATDRILSFLFIKMQCKLRFWGPYKKYFCEERNGHSKKSIVLSQHSCQLLLAIELIVCIVLNHLLILLTKILSIIFTLFGMYNTFLILSFYPKRHLANLHTFQGL